jgi:hypothetical protein
MQKDRQEILAIGELALFLAVWMLGIVAVVDEYRGRPNPNTGNEIAATSNLSDLRDSDLRDLLE